VSGLAGGAGPFAALGLPPRADLTDDDVRAAWRRIATATHPDRADGGDPARFAVAAAAYTVLRTRSGRGEALADLAALSAAPRLPRRPASRSRPLAAPSQADTPSRPAALSEAGTPTRADTPSRPLDTPSQAGTRAWADAPARADAPSRPLDTPSQAGAPAQPDTPSRPYVLPAAWRVRPGAARWLSRIRRGRPARLALRVLIAAALSAVAVAVAGSAPATPALITGALTWLLLTARHDLAPPP
jgi:curved DNA-binding protein CbpA